MFRFALISFFLTLTCLAASSRHYQTADQKRISALEAQIKTLEQSLDLQKEELLKQQKNDLFELRNTIQKQQARIDEQQKAIEESLNPDYRYFYDSELKTKFEQTSWLALIFPVLFLGSFLFMIWRIRKSKYSLKNALSEPNGNSNIESSSRLIAFISGSMAAAIGLTLFVCGLYIYMQTGIVPDFSILVNALLALGIGVVPYSINKVAGIFK